MDLGKPQYPIGDLHGNPHQFRELDETLLLAISVDIFFLNTTEIKTRLQYSMLVNSMVIRISSSR